MKISSISSFLNRMHFCQYFQDAENSTQTNLLETWTDDTWYTFKVWSNLIVTTILPLIILAVCNCGIFLTLRKSRRSMSAKNGNKNNSNAETTTTNNSTNSRQRNNDNSLAFILIGIVMVFMICHSLRFFLAFYQVLRITVHCS